MMLLEEPGQPSGIYVEAGLSARQQRPTKPHPGAELVGCLQRQKL